MNNFQKLKVGIIIEDTNQPYHINDLYKKSLNNKYYSIETLIIHKRNNTKNTLIKRLINFIKKNSINKIIDHLFFETIVKIETYLIKKKDTFKYIFLRYPISKFNIKKIYVEPEVSLSGLFYRYKNSDLKKIKNLNLDLIIRGGGGILKGEVLNICRLGIISFHHGDNNLKRVGAAGFWEVFNREPSTQFIIQRLKKDLDGGDVLCEGKIATSFLYKENYCKLYIKSSFFLHQTIEKLSFSHGEIKPYSSALSSYPLYKIPNYRESIFYLLKTFFSGLKIIIGKTLGFDYRWSVAYQFTKDWKTSVVSKSIIIKNPKGRFLADPFVASYENRTVLFVEDFNFKLNKAVISAYEINKKSYKEIGVAIEENFHLSYPSLIKNENDLFMIPESNQVNDIRIYKCVEFPLKWELSKILMKNISAADTNIIKFNNKYWMFTNIDSSKTDDHSSELHIFYSNDLLSTDWKPHKNNPVIFDSNQARNGGMIFSKNSELFRVFQRNGFNMYGRSLGISKIKNLDEGEYEEEILKIIEPNFFKNIKLTHHFSHNLDVLAIDFARFEKID